MKMAAIMKGKLGHFLTIFSASLASRTLSYHKNQKIFFHCSSLFYGQGQELKMPSLSPTMTEGKIVKWLKKEGDIINPGDVLCDIETDKAVVSMEVEEEGILAKILIGENVSNIKVGSLIGLMVSHGEDWKNVDIPAGAGVSDSDSLSSSPSSSPSQSSFQSTSLSDPIISGPSSSPIKMPSLSPTMTAGTIVKWLKKEGDTLAAGDVLCEIQTDKAVMSMEAEDDGILAKIVVPEDSKDVQVGTVIAVIVPEDEDWTKVTVDFQESSAEKRDSKDSQFVSTEIAETIGVKEKSFGPAVRALLSLYQLEPDLIKSTGRCNRLLKEDVLKYISDNRLEKKPPKVTSALPKETESKKEKQEKGSVKKPKSASVGASKYIDIDLSNVKRVTAKRLLESKQNIPHSYFMINCDINSLLKAKESLFAKGIEVTLNDLLIKATALALQLNPKANAQFINNEVKLSEKVDISVAVPTDLGLVTPVLKFTNQKSVVTISKEVEALSEKAKSGQLKPEDFQGGTFTISNLGMFGITHFKAIINSPQCGILAVGAIREIFDSNLICQKKISLSLSYNRRALEENEATKFMDTLKNFIENPKLLTSDVNQSINNEF